MTTNDLAAITARAAAASPGPWTVEEAWHVHEWVDGGDAEFIAHARTDVPDLVAEVTELRALLDEATRLEGATTEGDLAAWPSNAGEFAARWNARDTEWRERRVSSLVEMSARAIAGLSRPPVEEAVRLYTFRARWGGREMATAGRDGHRAEVEVTVSATDFALAHQGAADLLEQVNDVTPDLYLTRVEA